MAKSLKPAWWALTLVFTAVQMVMALFPVTLQIGGTGSYFSIDLISAPIIGYVLGPFYGTVSAFLGTFIATIVDPWAAGLMWGLGFLGGLLASIAPATGAFVAGSIRKGKYRAVPTVFIITIGLFLTTHLGLLAFGFLWLHIAALLLSLLFLVPQLKNQLQNGLSVPTGTSYPRAAISIWLLVFLSVMAEHIVASVLRVYLFLPVPATMVLHIFTDAVFTYPVERILASIIASFVVFLIAAGITRTNLNLPTRPLAEDEVLPTEASIQGSLRGSRSAEELTPPEVDSQ